MDDRQHETLMQEEVTNAQVDHYLWPTLFDRRNGTVLYKGRVVIKTNWTNRLQDNYLLWLQGNQYSSRPH